jgi:hypothetical protein
MSAESSESQYVEVDEDLYVVEGILDKVLPFSFSELLGESSNIKSNGSNGIDLKTLPGNHLNTLQLFLT